MFNKLAKWLSKVLPNHTVTITVEPRGSKKPAVAAEPVETAEMKRWRLLADHNRELAEQQKRKNKKSGLNPQDYVDRNAYMRAYREKNRQYYVDKAKAYRLAKAAAEGRELRSWTARNLDVSATTDRKGYNQAYYNQVKFTGTNGNTFKN